MPACRNRKITTSQLINPVVRFDFHMISRRGKEQPPGADEFTSHGIDRLPQLLL
jgi:hypothetical protein